MITEAATIEAPATEAPAESFIGTATYSPEDNKLRLYPFARLDAETYERVKAAGYKWAPRQELFVAPMWTPARYDLLIELCGEVGDEDTSLVDRAEIRAERFDGYSDKRAADARHARKAVESIADGIPMGQPILIGHHSERRARKDAERIESGMRRAVSMWETSKYWESRAAGALAHAKYKEKPTVRARRIKTLGAEMRKHEREIKQCGEKLALWSKDGLTLEQARIIAGHCSLTVARGEDGQRWSAYDVLRPADERYKACPEISMQQVVETAKRVYPRSIAYQQRWIAHYQNRIAYETAMLAEQGAADLLKPKARPTQLPICNYDGEVTIKGRYGNPPKTYKMHHMTKAEYSATPSENRGTWEAVDGSHRVKVAVIRDPSKPAYMWQYCPVFLTDSKVHAIPAAPAPVTAAPRALPAREVEPRPYRAPEVDEFADMKAALKEGVQVVAADQLFATPADLAERMADMAEIEDGQRILEPSAGTGAILNAISGEGCEVVAVEINGKLAAGLRNREGVQVIEGDFMEVADTLGTFDRILMNPPFANAQDVKHITQAASMLRAGGVLVAICANGPRQNDKLRPLVEASGGEWEPLPAGTFKNAGTNVNTVLLTIRA